MFRLLCFIFFCQTVFAQVQISGVIVEAQSQKPIPYASVGISGKNYGTISKESGEFILKLPYITDKDTLKVSAIGFETVSFIKSEFKNFNNKVIALNALSVDLSEVKIKPKKVKTKVLGTKKYSIKNCSAFVSEENNWRGSQAAILAGNKKGQMVYLEDFNFYIIKNTYDDSLKFRLMFYPVSVKGYPRWTFLKKPIIFKTNVKQGEVHIDLKDYCITTDDDFFISLECLEEEMDANRFCFAGSINTPSYVKTSAFTYWKRVKGGGADFNVTVSYVKE